MKWLTILFALFLVLIVILADTGNLGLLAIVYRLPQADKVGHFILYGILAFLLDITLFRSFPNRDRLRITMMSGLILIPLIGLEEFSQRNFPNRTFSLADLSASYLGVAFFAWLALRTKRI